MTKAKQKRRDFKKLRVLVLVHEDLIPPESMEGYSDKEMQEWKAEYDVVTTLREMQHEVRPLGVWDDLGKIRKEIDQWNPHVAFNMLEEFHGVAVYDQHVVSYLELLRQPLRVGEFDRLRRRRHLAIAGLHRAVGHLLDRLAHDRLRPRAHLR